ncbi:hypothetical protein P8452_40530 [Trifolium repens]|nr:hypothetical protein P8452_40530 [Trifolium repens]
MISDQASFLSTLSSKFNAPHLWCNSGQEPKSIIQYYKRSFGDFMANLTKEEANKMADFNEVMSVFPNKKRELLTMKSWNFVGMIQHVKRHHYESNIVISN